MSLLAAGGGSATQPNNLLLSNPTRVVPKYAQLVFRVMGPTFPRSRIHRTPNTTNNAIWNTHLWLIDLAMEDEAKLTGKLCRVSKTSQAS